MRHGLGGGEEAASPDLEYKESVRSRRAGIPKIESYKHSAKTISPHVTPAMQHKVSPQCIDPNLLNPNEHMESANLAYDCSLPFDDLEIATGQASFEDGDIHLPGSRITPHRSHAVLEDPDYLSAQFDYKYGHYDNPTSQDHKASANPPNLARFKAIVHQQGDGTLGALRGLIPVLSYSTMAPLR